MPAEPWSTKWIQCQEKWVEHENALDEVMVHFKDMLADVPMLEEYAKVKTQLKQLPWVVFAQTIADGIDRADERLDSAATMSIEELGKYVEDWRTACGTVDKLIGWSLFRDSAAKTLCTFSRPGAYLADFMFTGQVRF